MIPFLRINAPLGCIAGWLGCGVLLLLPVAARAQGVTTGAMLGTVRSVDGQPVQGASVVAIHEPSGTTYESVTRADGRFSILGMRVGGPYTVVVNYVGTGGAFEPQTITDLTVNLGVSTDVTVQVKAIAVQETVTVTGTSTDAVFSSNRTGAATTVTRDQLALLPTVSGRYQDITRLTPQASGSNFVGQDNRMNNITVDGSSFNNSFGLGGQPGDRTGVAPISLEAIEQLQVNVAPVRRAPGQLHRRRREHGHPQRHQPDHGVVLPSLAQPGLGRHRGRRPGRQPGHVHLPQHRRVGRRADHQEQVVRVRQLRRRRKTRGRSRRSASNPGGEPVGGSVTRVLASDLTTLSSFLQLELQLRHRPVRQHQQADARPSGSCCAATTTSTTRNKVSFRYNHLTRSPTSACRARRRSVSAATQQLELPRLPELQLPDSREHPVGHRRVELRHRHHDGEQLVPDRLHLPGREPRLARQTCSRSSTSSRAAAPTRRSASSRSPSTTSCATRRSSCRTTSRSSPRSTRSRSAATSEKYHSDNVFFGCCPQSNFVYNSLADFYADANGFIANPTARCRR